MYIESINRNTDFEMQTWLFALIKPKYSKRLRVFVDGIHIKHRFAIDDSLFVVSCILPNLNRATPTDIKLVLPNTHSPMELGLSQAEKKLGIAISEIQFCTPSNGLVRLLKQFKL